MVWGGWQSGGREGGQGQVGYHLDKLVAELLQDDEDPGGRIVVLGRGPDEADGIQHLGDEVRELGRDGPGGHFVAAPQHTPPHGSRRGPPRGRKRHSPGPRARPQPGSPQPLLPQDTSPAPAK